MLALAAGCQGGEAADASSPSAQPSVRADVVQLRRDQVLQRVEVAVENRSAASILISRLTLQVPGFTMPPTVQVDAPIPPGQTVNLPVAYTGVHCPAEGTPSVGPPRVTLHLDDGGTPAGVVRLAARDADGLLQRIATRSCAVERVRREVDLRFADDWRLTKGPGGPVLHGTLQARLRVDEPRDVTQVAGAIMYGLKPDVTKGLARTPLAALTPASPTASIPVITYAARCDGHTIGEIKKPYEFLVWVGRPGAESLAVTPTVDPATKLALRKVCAF